MSNTYRNPILPGFNPDPSLCHVPGVGFFASTSSFEFFPGLPIYHSTDAVNWKLIGHAINRRSQGVEFRTLETSGGLWAPTFRYYNKRWYMICSCFYRLRVQDGKPDIISHGFYVSTDDIFDDSKWSDAVFFEEVGFDQDLLFDDDGRVYQTVTRFNFEAPPLHGNPRIESYINEIDLATGQSLTAPVLAKASPLGVAEGCHILKKDGWYYFFTAEGGTQDGHRECVYRSKSPTGPFEPPPEGINPLIYNADHPDIQNTGHMDLVPGDDGKWIAIFLGVRPVFEAGEALAGGGKGMPSHLGRETFMAPVEWVDGWPVVNKRKPIELVGEAPGLTYVPEVQEWSADFSLKELELGWYHIRTPLHRYWSLTDRPGYLAIRGGAHTLAMEACPSALLQKQLAFDLDWSTSVDFDAALGQEAGTVVYLTGQRHASLGVRGTSKGLEVVYRAFGEETTFPISRGPVALIVKARKQTYELLFKAKDADWVSVGLIATEKFVPMFTGTQLGLYAQGASQIPCVKPAYFEYAKWKRV